MTRPTMDQKHSKTSVIGLYRWRKRKYDEFKSSKNSRVHQASSAATDELHVIRDIESEWSEIEARLGKSTALRAEVGYNDSLRAGSQLLCVALEQVTWLSIADIWKLKGVLRHCWLLVVGDEDTEIGSALIVIHSWMDGWVREAVSIVRKHDTGVMRILWVFAWWVFMLSRQWVPYRDFELPPRNLNVSRGHTAPSSPLQYSTSEARCGVQPSYARG